MKTYAISCALIVASMAGVHAPAQADVIVTASNGGAARTYPRGTRYPDSQVFILGRRDSVTVMGPDGPRRFRGSGRHSILGPRAEAGPIQSTSSNPVVATTRGPGELPYTTGWDVDLAGPGGAFCYAEGAPLALWRPHDRAVAEVTISGPDGATATASIPDERYAAPWPENFAPVPGQSYSIRYDDNEPLEIIMVPLTADLNDPVETAAALAEQECFDQLQALGRVPEDEEA